MTTFVLVHGAWGGSYGFRHVRPLLHAQGHHVFTPSLTGIGERSHLTGPMVGLSTHVVDATNTIRYEDLDDVVLLGFSYGGMVVTGMMERIADRVRSLVYLDAFVPGDGQSVVDLVPMSLVADDQPGAPWSLAPLPRELETPEATAWMNARRVDQPLRTFTEPVSLSMPLEERGIPLTFVKATADPAERPDSAFWRAARHAEQSPSWRYHEIDTNHMIPMTRPEDLVEILLEL